MKFNMRIVESFKDRGEIREVNEFKGLNEIEVVGMTCKWLILGFVQSIIIEKVE